MSLELDDLTVADERPLSDAAMESPGSPVLTSDDSACSNGGVEGDDNRVAWPTQGIIEPGEHDCLTGRGGGTNYHPGNILYRKMIEDKKAMYKKASRGDKPRISLQIVKDWRQLDPPGRFLKMNKTGTWDDVGDEEAKLKVGQSLREKRPSKLVTEANTNAPERRRSGQLQPAATAHVALRDAGANAGASLSGLAAASSMRNPQLSVGKPVFLPGQLQTQQQGSGIQMIVHPNLSILGQCLFAIGIDHTRLSGTVEEEFNTIKSAFFSLILRIHPDCSPRSEGSTSFNSARAAFGVLKSMFHKLRLKRSSFSALAADTVNGGAGHIINLYAQSISTWYGNPSYPSLEFFSMAARQEHPLIDVEISDGSCQCTKCQKTIGAGELQVGLLDGQEYGQWQHMNCWSVPLDIWLGLTQPLDAFVSLRDTLALDGVLLTGFAALDLVSQHEFVSYILERKNWVIARANAKSPENNQPRMPGCFDVTAVTGGLGGEPFVDQTREDSDGDASDTSRELARPIKKRAVEDTDAAYEC